MITTGAASLSDYSNRTVTIHVTGLCNQDVMRMSDYTVKVPYSRMSQAIQRINSLGGKVAGIALGSSAPALKAAAPKAAAPKAAASKAK